MNILLKSLFVGSILGSIGLCHAADSASVDKGQVSISAQVTRKVTNNQMEALIFREDTKKNAAALADDINASFNEAYQLAKQYPNVKVETKEQQTYPIYDNNQKLTGWRTRAELAIKTTDFKQGSQLIARLQEKFQLASIRFSPSADVLANLENELLKESIEAFKAKAELVRKSWEAKQYELIRMDFDNNGGYQPPMFRMAAAPALKMDSAPVAQDYQGGDSNIRASANGTIQLIFK